MSQPLAVACPHCHAQFAVSDPKLIGKQVGCPNCSQPFVVAHPQQAQQPAQAFQQPAPQPAAGGFGGGDDPLGLGGGDPLADPLGGGHDPFAQPAQQRPYAPGRKKKRGGDWKKPAMIAGGAAAGIAMLVLLVMLLMNLGGGGGAQRRGGDGNVVDMTWFPPSTDGFAYVDIQSLMNSKLLKDINAANPNSRQQMDQAMSELQEKTGLTTDDFESLTVSIPPTRPGSVPAGLGVVRLSKDFDESKLEGEIEEVSGRKLMKIDFGTTLMVADPRTIVIGEANAVRAAAEAGPVKRRFEKFDFVDTGHDMFFAWAPEDITALRQAAAQGGPNPAMLGMAPAGTAEAVDAVKNHMVAAAGGVSLQGDNIDLSVQLNCDSSGPSGDIKQGLSSLLAEAKTKYNEAKGMLPSEATRVADQVIGSIKVRQKGTSVAVGLRFTIDDQLKNAMQSQVQRQMGGGNPFGLPFGGNPFGGNPFGGGATPPSPFGGGTPPNPFGGGTPPNPLSGGTPAPNPFAPSGSSGNPVADARDAARRMENSNKLKMIGLAMHNFHDVHSTFPPPAPPSPNGPQPLLSWRVHVLPYLEERPLYERFKLNEPWDSPSNKALLTAMPRTFQVEGSTSRPGTTQFLAIDMPGAAFEGNRGVKMRDITDGSSNTAMVVIANPAMAVEWTKPADYRPPSGALQAGLALHPVGGRPATQVLFCDGSVRSVWTDMDAAQWRNMFVRNDGNPLELN